MCYYSLLFNESYIPNLRSKFHPIFSWYIIWFHQQRLCILLISLVEFDSNFPENWNWKLTLKIITKVHKKTTHHSLMKTEANFNKTPTRKSDWLRSLDGLSKLSGFCKGQRWNKFPKHCKVQRRPVLLLCWWSWQFSMFPALFDKDDNSFLLHIWIFQMSPLLFPNEYNNEYQKNWKNCGTE